MYRALGVCIVLLVLGGCTNKRQSMKQIMAQGAAQSDSLVVSLKECASFLETGSYNPDALSTAGFEPYSRAFAIGTNYRYPEEQGHELTINMRDAISAEQPAVCAISTGYAKMEAAFVKAGFEITRPGKDAIVSLNGVDFNVKGSYRGPGRGGPLYLTVKLADG